MKYSTPRLDTGTEHQDARVRRSRSGRQHWVSSVAAGAKSTTADRQQDSKPDPSHTENQGSHTENQGSHTENQGSRRAYTALLVSTCAIGAVVLVTAIVAVTLLLITPTGTPWTPIFQEIVKVSYQALAVGALGGLAKLLIDRRRDREAQDNELRERRHRYITSVVAASHQIDNAQLLLLANRSVLTWTTIVNNDLIPARTQLRQLTHSLRNWADAGHPVFGDSEEVITDHLESMHHYLGDLVDEYASNKSRLSEMQRSAEKAEGQQRTRLLAAIWREMRRLTLFGDYVNNGDYYAVYRAEYLRVLGEMRSSLAGS